MEVKDCKTKVSMMEKQLNSLQAECVALKEKSREQDRYRRRWNLRIKGMPEKVSEDTRGEVICLLSKIAPHWEQKMEDIVDSASDQTKN